MRIYKRYEQAKKIADGRPILRVGDAYVVGDYGALTQIEIIHPSGSIRTSVAFGKLEKLGNINHLDKSLHRCETHAPFMFDEYK